VYTPEEAESTSRDARAALVQHPANLLDHRLAASGALARLGERGVGLQARSVFLQGLFVLDVEHLPPSVRHCRDTLMRLRTLLARHELAPADVALAAVLAQPFERVIVGADDEQQLSTAVRRATRELPDGLLGELRNAFLEPDLEVIDPRRWRA
jgi:aryl-alcohol dehydrogenase-like predicted oxidoreductase